MSGKNILFSFIYHSVKRVTNNLWETLVISIKSTDKGGCVVAYTGPYPECIPSADKAVPYLLFDAHVDPGTVELRLGGRGRGLWRGFVH